MALPPHKGGGLGRGSLSPPGGIRGGPWGGGPWGGGRSLMDFAPEVHGLRLLTPWRVNGRRCLSLPFRQCKVTKKYARNKIALRGVFGVRCLWCHTCPQSAYLKNNIIIYIIYILLYYFYFLPFLTCIPCICPFLRCQITYLDSVKKTLKSLV